MLGPGAAACLAEPLLGVVRLPAVGLAFVVAGVSLAVVVFCLRWSTTVGVGAAAPTGAATGDLAATLGGAEGVVEVVFDGSLAGAC